MFVRLRPLLGPLALLLILLRPSGVGACSIDGIASIVANGNMASLTGGRPTAATIRYWAPFTLIAAAPGDTLRVSEDIAKLLNTLPREAFANPFRWEFGDGAAARGNDAAHRYAREGWYRISVSYNLPARNRWIEFDRAEQQIVPAGALLQENLGYYIGKGFMIATKVLAWASVAGLLAGGLWLWLWRTGRLPRARGRLRL